MSAKILIIEDDDQVRDLLKKILQGEGYEVLSAVNGAEGLKMYEQENPGLIITDLIMPEKEGIETIRELRKSDPDVKIIAMSGGGTIDAGQYLLMAERLGVAKTFKKPFRRNDIIEAVSELI